MQFTEAKFRQTSRVHNFTPLVYILRQINPLHILHTMKALEGSDILLHSFWTLVLDGSEWSIHATATLTPREELNKDLGRL